MSKWAPAAMCARFEEILDGVLQAESPTNAPTEAPTLQVQR